MAQSRWQDLISALRTGYLFPRPYGYVDGQLKLAGCLVVAHSWCTYSCLLMYGSVGTFYDYDDR